MVPEVRRRAGDSRAAERLLRESAFANAALEPGTNTALGEALAGSRAVFNAQAWAPLEGNARSEFNSAV
eukprot:3610004-Lingulodinium_polyedra.AAC.1